MLSQLLSVILILIIIFQAIKSISVINFIVFKIVLFAVGFPNIRLVIMPTALTQCDVTDYVKN